MLSTSIHFSWPREAASPSIDSSRRYVVIVVPPFVPTLVARPPARRAGPVQRGTVAAGTTRPAPGEIGDPTPAETPEAARRACMQDECRVGARTRHQPCIHSCIERRAGEAG
ncbi:hypothetical protein CPE01_01680 [Cellulomonas persica]|uniref:Uncharacterized protein n=1 Tax=Cellulomonas persica TaxID=76861 RepID=A0A510UUE4_9CELL|nr:hypothetical protein CPE01_01680 [Cellulomonas persica]